MPSHKQTGRKMVIKKLAGAYKLVSPQSKRQKQNNDSLPVTKADLKDAVNQLVWPPMMLRDQNGVVLSKKFQDLNDLMTKQSTMSPQQFLTTFMTLSSEVNSLTRNFFANNASAITGNNNDNTVTTPAGYTRTPFTSTPVSRTIDSGIGTTDDWTDIASGSGDVLGRRASRRKRITSTPLSRSKKSPRSRIPISKEMLEKMMTE